MGNSPVFHGGYAGFSWGVRRSWAGGTPGFLGGTPVVPGLYALFSWALRRQAERRRRPFSWEVRRFSWEVRRYSVQRWAAWPNFSVEGGFLGGSPFFRGMVCWFHGGDTGGDAARKPQATSKVGAEQRGRGPSGVRPRTFHGRYAVREAWKEPVVPLGSLRGSLRGFRIHRGYAVRGGGRGLSWAVRRG